MTYCYVGWLGGGEAPLAALVACDVDSSLSGASPTTYNPQITTCQFHVLS